MVLTLHEAPLALADLPIGDRPGGAQPTGAGAGRWPRLWSERELLLERQHQILHDLISARILQVIAGSDAPESAVEAAGQPLLRQLLRQLHLHLRLEERWLGSCGCLCPGHRAIHQLVARDTQAGLRQAGSDRQQQLIWLRGLQAWLLEHTDGPDAHAYALARSISSSQP